MLIPAFLTILFSSSAGQKMIQNLKTELDLVIQQDLNVGKISQLWKFRNQITVQIGSEIERTAYYGKN